MSDRTSERMSAVAEGRVAAIDAVAEEDRLAALDVALLDA
jgi:hypothetical protein